MKVYLEGQAAVEVLGDPSLLQQGGVGLLQLQDHPEGEGLCGAMNLGTHSLHPASHHLGAHGHHVDTAERGEEGILTLSDYFIW